MDKLVSGDGLQLHQLYVVLYYNITRCSHSSCGATSVDDILTIKFCCVQCHQQRIIVSLLSDSDNITKLQAIIIRRPFNGLSTDSK